MKIVNLVTQLEPAGAQGAAVRMTDQLRARGHTAESLFIYRKRPAFEDVEGIRVLYEQRPPAWQVPLVLLRLVREFRVTRPDAVIAYTHFACVLGCTAAWLAGVPARVATLRNPVDTFPVTARWLDAVLGTIGCYTRTIAVSKAVAASASRYPAPYRKRLIVVSNGISAPEPSSTRCQVREELGIPEGQTMLIHVGRLHLQKNHEFLLQVMLALPDAMLILVGDGELRGEIADQARLLGLEDRVRILGEFDGGRVAALMQAADVFLFPSRYEAFGFAMVEAMAVGCPVIASDVPSTIEVLDAQSGTPAGVILPARSSKDAALWADWITRLMSAPELRADFVRRGKARAQRYSLSAMVDGYESAATEE